MSCYLLVEVDSFMLKEALEYSIIPNLFRGYLTHITLSLIYSLLWRFPRINSRSWNICHWMRAMPWMRTVSRIVLQPKRSDVVRKRGGYVFKCRGSNCKSRSIRFSQIKEYCAILIHIFPKLRVLASGNDTLSHFTISKRYFINYTIPFYNTPNIPKFYFTILHIKI